MSLPNQIGTRDHVEQLVYQAVPVWMLDDVKVTDVDRTISIHLVFTPLVLDVFSRKQIDQLCASVLLWVGQFRIAGTSVAISHSYTAAICK
jgi:hypothetical protein